jgi:hypothetical protein
MDCILASPPIASYWEVALVLLPSHYLIVPRLHALSNISATRRLQAKIDTYIVLGLRDQCIGECRQTRPQRQLTNNAWYLHLFNMMIFIRYSLRRYVILASFCLPPQLSPSTRLQSYTVDSQSFPCRLNVLDMGFESSTSHYCRSPCLTSSVSR